MLRLWSMLGIGCMAVAVGMTGQAFGQVLVSPLPERSMSLEGGYDPATTALLINLCRESLCKITSYNDRVVLDEEYHRLVNNIDVTQIRDDEVAELIKQLMLELNALKLDEASKARIVGEYERKMNVDILKHIKPAKEAAGSAATIVEQVCRALLMTAWGTTNRAKAIANYKKELAEKIVTLDIEEQKRLATLRTAFFGTEYALYRRYSLPDRLNLKEVQLEQYIRVTQDEDPVRRLQRLERIRDDFEAYPPFWYQTGLAAQESGDHLKALHYYQRYDDTAVPVMREDPDRVGVCMHRIMLLDPAQDRAGITRDLERIERNTRYYYRWEHMLFAAITYYRLGDVENARRLIQISIDEGHNVAMHERIQAEMEGMAALATLEGARIDALQMVEDLGVERVMRLGRANHLETVRAIGAKLLDIRLAVAPRSRSRQNAAFAVPGYNVYLLGREVIKGDVYFDDITARIPAAWGEDESFKASILFNGKRIKASEVQRDEGNGDLLLDFMRVFEGSDITKKGWEFQCELHLETTEGEINLEYEAGLPTPDVLQLYPDWPADKPWFKLRGIRYLGEGYQVDHGLIMPR